MLYFGINFGQKGTSFWIRRLILFSSPHWVWEIAAVQSYTRFRPHRPWPGSVRTAFDLRCALWLKSAAERENSIFTKCFTCTRHAYLHAKDIVCTSLTQAPSLRGFSGSETAMYSFLVHTATTSTPSIVKKASNPVPLAVKKLGEPIRNCLPFL